MAALPLLPLHTHFSYRSPHHSADFREAEPPPNCICFEASLDNQKKIVLLRQRMVVCGRSAYCRILVPSKGVERRRGTEFHQWLPLFRIYPNRSRFRHSRIARVWRLRQSIAVQATSGKPSAVPQCARQHHESGISEMRALLECRCGLCLSEGSFLF